MPMGFSRKVFETKYTDAVFIRQENKWSNYLKLERVAEDDVMPRSVPNLQHSRLVDSKNRLCAQAYVLSFLY